MHKGSKNAIKNHQNHICRLQNKDNLHAQSLKVITVLTPLFSITLVSVCTIHFNISFATLYTYVFR
jgi:hypothetical protein